MLCGFLTVPMWTGTIPKSGPLKALWCDSDEVDDHVFHDPQGRPSDASCSDSEGSSIESKATVRDLDASAVPTSKPRILKELETRPL